jgi:hypothetical protein
LLSNREEEAGTTTDTDVRELSISHVNAKTEDDPNSSKFIFGGNKPK